MSLQNATGTVPGASIKERGNFIKCLFLIMILVNS